MRRPGSLDAVGFEKPTSARTSALQRSRFEVWGEEMIQKVVSLSGSSGRVYLPAEWIGRHVKIIRVD